ncbi:glycosyltransferase [Kineosporia babensis]
MATGSQVTVYAMAPLVAAARNAGHQVVMAANEPLIGFVENLEIPAVAIMPQAIRHFMEPGPAPQDARENQVRVGRAFARMAGAGREALLQLAQDWPPDRVVGGSMSYGAGLLARQRGVPYTRHAEYFRIPLEDIDSGAAQGLQHGGLGELPQPDQFIETSPPSLRSKGFPDAQLMRWVPRNPQRRLEPWMYARRGSRPRVLITSGTHFRMLSAEATRDLAAVLVSEGMDVLIAATQAVAQELGPSMGPHVQVGWIPLDVVAHACDLAIHHGGATTSMTLLEAGVPQVIVPPNMHTQAIAEALTDFGAALTVPADAQHEPVSALAASSLKILHEDGFAQRARALAQENAALASPADVVLPWD